MRWLDESEFNDNLCKRLRELRTAKHWTIEQMADAIGVPPERYRKYEVRSPVPAYLMPRLAQICDTDVSYILTGKHSFPVAPSPRIQAMKRIA